MALQQDTAAGELRAEAAIDAASLGQFLHHGHVFSSAVKEILEVKFLAEVSHDSMTVPQFNLLKIITINGRHQVGEIAELLGVTSPAVSKNIDKLEGMGLVIRRHSAGDRRVTLLSASSKGRALVERYEKLKAERLGPVLAEFDAEELTLLGELMSRFSSRLFEREDSGVGFCLRCAAYGDPNCTIAEIHGNCPFLQSPPASEAETG